MKRSLILVSFIIPVMAYAQFTYLPDQSIVVHKADGSVIAKYCDLLNSFC